MRVVIVINGLGTGGGERHVAHLVRGLRQRDHAVQIFCLIRGGVVADELRRQGVSVDLLTREGRPHPVAWSHLVAAASGADVVHTHFFYSDLVGRALRVARRRAGLISTRHETGFWMNAAHRRMEPWLYRGFDRVVCVSEAVRSSLVARGIDAQRLVHVRPGIPFDPAAAPRPASATPKTILFAGRLERVKGADLLLDAFAGAGTALADWELVICGDGSQRAALTAQAVRLGLGERCRFVGDQPHGEVMALMRRATLFALPSRAEAVSLSLLEAMAAGLPVVASDVEGVREVVTHDVHGLRVAPGSAAALTEGLARLAADAGLRQRLADAAAALVRARYGVDRFVDEMVAIYSGEAPPAAAERR